MTIKRFALLCAVAAFAINGVTPVQAQNAPAKPAFVPQSGQAGKDVVWVPSPQALVDRMLDMAKVTKDDYLVDLGSGDGRTVITAAKRGVRALGIEYNPDMVALSKENATKEGVTARATFQQADIFQSDFSSATVVTLFLLPQLNERLRPTLLNMKPGTRVVSNTFTMGDWTPDETIDAGGNCDSWCTAHKWIIPAKVAGNWKVGNGQLTLDQKYQDLSGTFSAAAGGQAAPISSAKMNGADITFIAGGKKYTGKVEGNAMRGTIEGGGTWSATKA